MANLPRSLESLRYLAQLLLSGLALPSLFACGDESLKPALPAEPSDVYWSLTLDHQALTMGPRAPYDTLTITATPRNVAGGTLTGLPAPTYLSTDVTTVTVTPEGVVRVLGSGFEPVWVVATLVSGNVRHADSVRVRSVDVEPPPVLTAFSIHPLPPDSAKRALGSDLVFGFGGGFPPLPARAADANALPITDLMVSFRSLDTNVSVVDKTSGVLHPVTWGDVTFTGSTTMFGRLKADTLRYRIGFPLRAFISISTGSPIEFSTASVGVGGAVLWIDPQAEIEGFRLDFEGSDLATIREATASAVFDAYGTSFLCLVYQADCSSSGNVIVARPSVGAVRTFTAPGTYYYHASPYGVTGRVDVIDER